MPQGYDEANAAFRADNGCYTVENAGASSVTNPKGMLFLSANSAADTPAVTGTCSFSDVPATHAQLAAMLYRAALHSGKAVTADNAKLNSFIDAAAVSAWAKDAMSYAVSAGLFPNATLAPKAIATAAELTAVLGK